MQKITYNSEVLNLLSNIYSMDKEVYAHCVRVGYLVRCICVHMGISKDLADKYEVAGLLHDYGKLLVPRRLLNKPGPLTDEEFEKVQNHVDFAKYMMRGNLADPVILGAISSHHENVDGTGYPRGISDVCLGGQLVSVADVYDALTHERAYKSAFSKEETLAKMKEEIGTKFEEWSVRNLEEIVSQEDFDLDNDCCDKYSKLFSIAS